MKKAILILTILFGSVMCINNDVQAQQINININIGSQPSWGPVGYDYVDYYFIPEMNVYYILGSRMFVYPEGRRWITARYLPYRYRHYDLYGMHKVVMVGGPHNPWIHNHRHYREYSKFRNHRGQHVIRDSRDIRYRDSRNNHATWYRENNSQRPVQTQRPVATTRPQNNSRPGNRPSSNVSTSTRPGSGSNMSNRSGYRTTSSDSKNSSTVRSSSDRNQKATNVSSRSTTVNSRSSSRNESKNNSSRTERSTSSRSTNSSRR